MVKLIIFDVDGVLIGTDAYFWAYRQTLNDIGVKLNPKIEREIIVKYWGTGYKNQLTNLLKKHRSLIPKATKIYRKYVRSKAFARQVELVKGTEEVLKILSKKYHLAIATAKRKESFIKHVPKKIRNFFEFVMTASDVGSEKDLRPSPYMLNKIMERFSVSNTQTVYVCDGENDVLMAKNADVTPIVVLTGNLTQTEAEKLDVEQIIPDVSYLNRIL